VLLRLLRQEARGRSRAGARLHEGLRQGLALLLRRGAAPEGRRIQPGANRDEVVAITAKHTGASPDVIRVGFPYQDRNGRFPAEDIEKQMTWWVRHGFMKATIPRREIVDTSFVEAAIKALGE